MQTNKLTTKPIAEVLSAIQVLDLESVKARLMDSELGKGWTREYTDAIEAAYKRFLTILIKHQEHAEDILLAHDVDEFWHAHILHTMKYAEDCDRVFGKFLHHTPQARETTPEALQERAVKARKSRQLYGREAAFCGAAVKADGAAFCGAAVKADGAAFCGAAVEAGRAAFCGAAVEADGAAFCGAAVKADSAAFCGAAIKADGAAFCGAAVKADGAAFCGAAVEAGQAAFCGAAAKADGAAFCGAAVKAEEAAFCGAAASRKESAPSGVAV